MFPRLLIIGSLVLVEILWLMNVASSATNAPNYEVYTVQANQTVSSIADEYGIPATTLAQYNKIRVDTPLKTGAMLMVPISVGTPSQINIDSDADSSHSASQHTAYIGATGNKVTGFLSTVTAKSASIRTQPSGGDVIFDKVKKGTQLLVTNQTDTHYAVLMSDGSIGWIPRFALSVTDTQMMVDRPNTKISTPSSTDSGGRQNLVDTAMEYLGIPYKYGGHLPDNVDCSLLIQTVFARNGISLPRTAAQQFRVGMPVDADDLQVGDRLYFYDRGTARIGHTGMYIGDGKFIHASSNRGAVAINLITDKTYTSIYAGARR